MWRSTWKQSSFSSSSKYQIRFLYSLSHQSVSGCPVVILHTNSSRLKDGVDHLNPPLRKTPPLTRRRNRTTIPTLPVGCCAHLVGKEPSIATRVFAFAGASIAHPSHKAKHPNARCKFVPSAKPCYTYLKSNNTPLGMPRGYPNQAAHPRPAF